MVLSSSYVDSNMVSTRYYLLVNFFLEFVLLDSFYLEKVEDTIVFDTIGITDTTGNMGKLGKYLRNNGKEHGYCTDHNLHLVARLAFDCEIS